MIEQKRSFGGGRLIRGLAVVTFVLAASHASAQEAQRLPLEKAVTTGEDAKRILAMHWISADVAERIVDACVDLAKAVNGSVSVFVLSPDGEIAHSHRMDGQGTVQTQTALRKAQTALQRRESTHAAANRFSTIDQRLVMSPQGYFLVPGGLPIVVDDVLIGTIGVGGGRGINDEQCAHQALTKVLGPQPPLAPNLPPNPLGTNGAR